jgi:hypothetical protein
MSIAAGALGRGAGAGIPKPPAKQAPFEVDINKFIGEMQAKVKGRKSNGENKEPGT